MKKVFSLFLGCFLLQMVIAQSQKPVFSSNSSITFEKFISGIKYAEIGLNSLNQEQVDKQEGIAGFYYVAQKYLMGLGFEFVALTSEEKTRLENSVNSYCEYTLVMFSGDINKNSVSNMSISFISCNGDLFTFMSNNKFTYRKFTDVEKKLIEDWRSIISSKGKYKDWNQLELPSFPSQWTKEKIVTYLDKNKGKLAPVEGVFERVRLSFEDVYGDKYSVGVIKDPEDNASYLMVYLSGAKNSIDWQSGEIKAVLKKTATPGFYSVHWIARDKSIYDDVYCNVDEIGFNVFSSGIYPIAYKFIKILPVSE